MKHLLKILFILLSIFTNAQSIDSLLAVLPKAINDSIKTEIQLNISRKYSKSNLDSSLFHAKKALTTAKLSNNIFLTSKSLNTIGNIYKLQDKWNQAKESYDNALNIAKKNSFYTLETDINISLGVLYIEKNDDKKALEYFLKSLEMAERIGYKKRINDLVNNIAVTLYNQKRYRKSLVYFKKYLEYTKGVNKNRLKIIALLNVSSVYNKMKNQDSAFIHIKEAIRINKKENNLPLLATSYNNLANIYHSKKEYNNTLKYYKKAENIHKQLNTTDVLLLENIGLLLSEHLNKIDDAEKYYLKAKDYIQKTKTNTKNLENIYLGLGQVYHKKHQYKKSYEYFVKTIAFNDSINKVTKEKEIAEIQIKYETEKKDKEIALQKSKLAQKTYKVKSKNILLAVLSLLFLVLILTVIFYVNKQKLTHQLRVNDKVKEERLRISRDLHDNIGAHLSFIISTTENTLYSSDKTPSFLLNKIQDIKEFASNTIDLFRDTIWTLNEETITVESFIGRLQSYIEKVKLSNENITINITSKTSEQLSLNPIQVINVYRTIQEAIQNAVKHTKTEKIDIVIKEINTDIFQIEIIDFGKGFDLNKTPKGYGIKNMRRRIADSKGTFEIESNKRGTRIVIVLPFIS